MDLNVVGLAIVDEPDQLIFKLTGLLLIMDSQMDIRQKNMHHVSGYFFLVMINSTSALKSSYPRWIGRFCNIWRA